MYIYYILSHLYFYCLSYSEIIGYVDGIESPRLVGNNQQYKFLKFYLNNNKGRRVQMAWNDDIKNVEHFIRSNHVNFDIYIYIYTLLEICRMLQI
jgi:hypothetical protein